MGGEKLWKLFDHASSGDDLQLGGATELDTCPRPGVSRRTFLELIGFSIAATALSGCSAPEGKIIPYTKQPVELTPGVANWYASVCSGCNAACGTLVKVRDGRPIKLEGNPDHPLSRGGLCPTAHAMVFGLYDSERLHQPFANSKPSSWEVVDKEIIAKLNEIKQAGGKVRVLSPALSSPSSRQAIEDFLRQFADGKHIVYEPFSTAAIRKAHLLSHGASAIPHYRFGRAKLIVSFGADFLGTWISPVCFARDYSQARDLTDGRRQLPSHIQLESRVSLTGSKADKRIKVSPAEFVQVLLLLARQVAEKTGLPPGSVAALSAPNLSKLNPALVHSASKLAERILSLPGESLVVSGSNDVEEQYLVNLVNALAGNYGATIDLSASVPISAGDDEFEMLVSEMANGQVSALIVAGSNPVYDYRSPQDFKRAMEKVPLTVSLNPALDETSSLASYVCPASHFLEAWDDAEPVRGLLSINQPAIAPLFQTRPYQESFLRWRGDQRSYYDYLRARWSEQYFPRQKTAATFDVFWDRALLDGSVTIEAPPQTAIRFSGEETPRVVRELQSKAAALASGLSVILYEKISLRNGRYANNPWLQELPDPISKVTWDNYLCLSPRLASQMQLIEGEVVRIDSAAASVEAPVHIQPGQQSDYAAIAVGYGRTKAGRAGDNVGVNAYPLVTYERGAYQYAVPNIRVTKTGRRAALAKTQVQDRLEDRPIVREVSLPDYIKGHDVESQHPAGEFRSLWPGYEYADHKWGLVIDLNACTGCSACVLSCQAENNIPVVGKEEVRNRREMHWLRIDRYYTGSDADVNVVYQPVMCQQCDNASCESVCPVLATVHSSEGLNMQVYNRCVGTRYCENNCPFKVRRFNWFQYPHSNPIANLALNPDVTVRTRGVMEKCSFCVQRIEAVKIQARNENRPIKDGEIQPACQQSCPARAITFGNLADQESRVSRLKHDHRNYTLLDDLNLRQPTSYLAIVRNSEEE